MNNLLVGLYGVWFLMVASKGNSAEAIADVQKDAPGFLPWVISIIVLAWLYNNEATQKAVKPFIFLIILAFVLKNYQTIKAQFGGIYQSATGTNVNGVHLLPNQTMA